MINLSSGLITFEDGVCIAPHDAIEAIESIPGAREVHAAQGRRQFALGSHPSNGQDWGVGAVFVESALRQVWLQCLTCVDETAMSLAEEKIRKSFHDKIVQAIELEGVLVQSRINRDLCGMALA